jgi:hypothetical protein
MSPAGAFDENDLLAMAPPALQRALLKAPDELIAQAIAGASPAVTAAILKNLSARRAAAIRSRSALLGGSGELGPRAARTALRNLVRRVFAISAPEAEGPAASRTVGASRPAGAAAGERPAEPPAADLTPRAFAGLRETRAVLDAARRVSPYVQGLERGKRGANAAVLLRAWMRRSS